jgi:hypothetical protein
MPNTIFMDYADPWRSARLVIAARLQIGNKTTSIIAWNRTGFSWIKPSFLATKYEPKYVTVPGYRATGRTLGPASNTKG